MDGVGAVAQQDAAARCDLGYNYDGDGSGEPQGAGVGDDNCFKGEE